MPGQVHANERIIKINGVPMTAENRGYIREIVIDDRLQLPAYMTITFDDIPGNLFDKIGANIGDRITFSASPVGESAPVPLFSGDITAFEASYVQTGAQIVLRAYDLLYRLQQGRHTEAYQNMSDADIVRKVAGRNKVPVGRAMSGPVFEHVTQANVSDWDFLKARARAAGGEMAMVDGQLEFREPTAASGAPSPGRLSSANPKQLVYHAELIEFHPRLTAGAQVTSVAVRSWDPTRKTEILAEKPVSAKTVKIGDTPSALATKVNERDVFLSSAIPVATASAANGLATALAEEVGSAFFEADGIAIGDPRLKAGTAVSIGGVAAKFAGGHVLSQVRHVFEPEYGYRTHFEIAGRQERSILGLATMGQTNGHVSQTGNPIYGLVIGIVTNINDEPEKQLRVKVTFPWLAPKTGQGAYESTWARVVHPGAGPKTGVTWMPEIDDEVLVGFEHGDIHRPFVLGGLYNGNDLPDLELQKGGGAHGAAGDLVSSGHVKRRGFVSRKGHRFIFVDDDQASQIAIKTSDGKLMIEWDEKKGELRITGNTKVIVNAEQELRLESKKDINIKAQGNLKLEAQAGVDMKSNAAFKIQGTQAEVKGSAQLALSGGIVKIN